MNAGDPSRSGAAALRHSRRLQDKRFMESLLNGEGGLLKDALLGNVKVEGNLLDIKTFLACFDFSDEPVSLTVR